MAAEMGRVLVFPVVPQISALPFDSPDTVIQHLEHELVRLYRLRCVMSPRESLGALGEVSLFARYMDGVEAACTTRAKQIAKATHLIA